MANENETSKQTSEYQKNYKTLEDTAQELRNAAEIDIDELLEKVQGAMEAYKYCKDRIGTVQNKLNLLLENAPGSEADSEDSVERKQQSSEADEMPF